MRLFLGLEDMPEWMFIDNHRWTKREMWLYMLFRAVKEPTTIYEAGLNIHLKTGQLVMLIKDAQALATWGQRACHEFREELEEMGWITMENAPWMPTIITIVDYEKHYLKGEPRNVKVSRKTIPDGDYTQRA